MDRDAYAREVHAREVIVRLGEDRKAEIARAVERGGLPNEQEQARTYDMLMRARDQLEAITWRVEGVSEAAHASELPRPATFADIGIVATVANDAECFANNLREFADRLRDKIGVLETLRDTSGSAISTGCGCPGSRLHLCTRSRTLQGQFVSRF
jgi:hypothetical protein